MLREVPSRSRGVFVSEDEVLMVEKVKDAGILVKTDNSGLRNSLSAPDRPDLRRASCRRPRIMETGSLQVRGGY